MKVIIRGYEFTYHSRTPVHICEIQPTGIELLDAYNSPSKRKINAYQYCKRMCRDLDGFGFGISGHNQMFFSVEFQFISPATGEHFLAHVTKSYNHLYKVIH